MARAPLRFRQRDVSAVLKACKAAGIPVARLEVGKDGVVIVPGEPSAGTEIELDGKLAAIDRMIRRPIPGRKRGG